MIAIVRKINGRGRREEGGGGNRRGKVGRRIKEKDDKRRGKHKSEKSVSPFDLYENYHVINTYWSFIIIVIITDDYDYDYYGYYYDYYDE